MSEWFFGVNESFQWFSRVLFPVIAWSVFNPTARVNHDSVASWSVTFSITCSFDAKLQRTSSRWKQAALPHTWTGNVLSVRSAHRTTSPCRPSERYPVRLLPDRRGRVNGKQVLRDDVLRWTAILPSLMFNSSSLSDVKLYKTSHLPIEWNSEPV